MITTSATRLTLATILAVGSYVRLAHPDASWFSVDQARDAHTALAILAGHSYPLAGVEVSGGPAHTWGPLYFYLIAIPFAISRDPAVAVAALSATSVAALFVTYRLGLVFFGRAVGLLSTALLATYPLAVLESTALWNVAPLSLLAALFFYALCSLVVHERSVMVIAVSAAFGALVQLHLSAVSLVVVLVAGVALVRPKIRTVHLIVGLGVFLVLMLPYLVAQCLSGFADFRAGVSFGTQFRLRGPSELASLVRHTLFVSPDVVAEMSALHDTRFPGLVLFLHRLEVWLFALGLVVVPLVVLRAVVGKGPRDPSGRAGLLVSLGVVIPIVMLGQLAPQQHYSYDVMFPLPAIAAALAVKLGGDTLGTIAGAGARRVLWAIVGVVVASTVITQVDFHRNLWRGIWRNGGIVLTPIGFELMPIRYKAALARALVSDFGADSPDVLLRTHGSRARDWLEDEGYFFDAAAAARRPGAATTPNRSLHYAVVLAESGGASLGGERRARAGPYTIVEYAPAIDYATWRCTDESPADASARGGDPGEWIPVTFPITRLPGTAPYPYRDHRRWRGQIVSCRGLMSGAPHTAKGTRLVVSVRTLVQGNPRVEALDVNGASIPPTRVLRHFTFGARTVDAVFDVSDHLRDGPNGVRLQVAEATSQFDVDLYELRDGSR